MVTLNDLLKILQSIDSKITTLLLSQHDVKIDNHINDTTIHFTAEDRTFLNDLKKKEKI